jgi:hypothetical protein
VFLTCCRSLDEVEEVVCREIPHRVPTPYSQISVDERQGLNRDWSPRFSTLWDKRGWIRTTEVLMSACLENGSGILRAELVLTHKVSAVFKQM